MVDRGRAADRRARPAAGAARRRRSARLERGALGCWPTPTASSPSAAARRSRSPARPRSSSRRPAICMPRRSAARNSVHGPVALVSARYPILMFMPTDEAAPRLARSSPPTCAARTRAVRRRAAASGRTRRLPALAPDHPETDAICLIQSFYAFLVRLARAARHRRRPAAPSAESDPHPMSGAAYTPSPPSHVFDGVAVHRDTRGRHRGAQIARGRCRAPTCRRPCRFARCRDGAWLAPGFIDVQVNGGGDVLFNDEPTPEGIARDRRGASPVRHDGAAADA